jgi:hypothetical protein
MIVWDAKTGNALQQIMLTQDCNGLQVSGAHGLGITPPEITTSIEKWFGSRGAVT